MAADNATPPAGMPDAEPPDGPRAPQSAPGLPGERVERTGIALVHEGEYIVPAPGSEAVLTPAAGTGPAVNYYFPVEVEVVGDLDDIMVKRVVAEVFAELDRELSSRL